MMSASKQKKAAEEKRRREEQEARDREARQRGEQLMEESFLQAQQELFAMARTAELKAADALAATTTVKSASTSNLDAVFTFLNDGMKTVSKRDENMFLEQVCPFSSRFYQQSPCHFPEHASSSFPPFISPRWFVVIGELGAGCHLQSASQACRHSYDPTQEAC